MIKSKLSIILLSLIFSLSIIIPTAQITYAEELFDIEAKSAILIDASTGKVLYEKNIHEKSPPASITKIMVLLLTMEALDSNKISLEDEVVISPNAAGMGGSQIYLEEGEIQKVEHLIRSIALRSANDSAVALGEHIAGSEELFIDMMNNRAKELGMNNTNYKNPTGLTEDEHYTTAYDISLMSKELLKYPKIHRWLTIWMSEVTVGKEKDDIQSLVNTNRLIYDYKGANGIKTGFTNAAGHCLAASATRGNFKLISVVLGAPSSKIRFDNSKKLLNYGFANYDSLPLVKKGEVITSMSVSKGKVEKVDILADEDLSLLLKKGESKNVEKETILPDVIRAPFEKDCKVGEIIYKIDGEEKGRVNLITKERIEKASMFKILSRVFNRLLGKRK